MKPKREEQETVRISLRLPKAVHEALVAQAQAERRSLNGQLVYLVEQAVKKPEPQS